MPWASPESTGRGARSSAGARRPTRALRRRPPATVSSASWPGTTWWLVMTSPGSSQMTPEPALPIEPRTSTTLRATSRASSPRALGSSAKGLIPSSVIGSLLVGARRGHDLDFAQIATANEAYGGGGVNRLGSEGHLKGFAVFDHPAADGEHNVAQQQTAALSRRARLQT